MNRDDGLYDPSTYYDGLRKRVDELEKIVYLQARTILNLIPTSELEKIVKDKELKDYLKLNPPSEEDDILNFLNLKKNR